jgi:hypothetical protein
LEYDMAIQHKGQTVKQFKHFLVRLVDGHDHSPFLLLAILFKDFSYDKGSEAI